MQRGTAHSVFGRDFRDLSHVGKIASQDETDYYEKALMLMRMKGGKIDTVLAVATNPGHAAAVPA